MSGLGELPFYNEDIDTDDATGRGGGAAGGRLTPTPLWSSPRSTTAASPAC